MSNPKTIQQVLSEALRQQGYRTLREAARATGLSTKTLRGALSGTTTPSVQTLLKLSGRLGLDSEALVRMGLRASALGEKLRGQQRFFNEWDLVSARARDLGEEAERDLLARCDWYLKGAEAARQQTAPRPSRSREKKTSKS